MIYELTVPSMAAGLFDGWEETMIWSCLDGTIGQIYGSFSEKTGTEEPESAMAVIGDFCFLSGEATEELVQFYSRECSRGYGILVPRDAKWAGIIEEFYGERAKAITRYAFKKKDDFDREYLKSIRKGLSEEYEIRQIDETLYKNCREISWSRDLVAQYSTYETFKENGLGFVVLKGKEIVSGASSYSSWKGGIEIEIDTREDYRRKGLAMSCGAALILACLDKGLYPSWDAHNKESRALAERLGYRFSHEYWAYECNESYTTVKG